MAYYLLHYLGNVIYFILFFPFSFSEYYIKRCNLFIVDSKQNNSDLSEVESEALLVCASRLADRGLSVII